MKIQLSLLLLAASLCGSARTLSVTPGGLEALLDAGAPSADSELILTGAIDGRDLITLASAEGITTLDLSRTEIKEYHSPEPLFPGTVSFPANTLTRYTLFGLKCERLILPASLREIGEGALSATSLREITVPEGVTSIADMAFYDSPDLKTVNLPSTLAEIGERAFARCPKLSDVDLGRTAVTRIPDRCFEGDAALRGLDTSKIREVGAEAFYDTGITHLSLPQTRIFSPLALVGMSRLEVVMLNKEAVYGYGTLFNSGSLVEIKGVPEIVPDLFAANCVSLSPAEAIAEATEIGRYAFANTGVDSFVLGRDISAIDASAFAGCHTLTDIDARMLAAFTPAVEPSAFSGIRTRDVRLIVAEGCEASWSSHPVWGEFNIVTSTTGTDLLPDAPATDLTLRVADGRVIASSASAGKVGISVYGINGQRIAATQAEGGMAEIPLDRLPSGVLLIDARDSAGGSRRLKIIL